MPFPVPNNELTNLREEKHKQACVKSNTPYKITTNIHYVEYTKRFINQQKMIYESGSLESLHPLVCVSMEDLNEEFLINNLQFTPYDSAILWETMEDVFEAFIGAMYLDFNEIEIPGKMDFYSGIGFQTCQLFIINVIEKFVDFSDLILNDYNYKDQLLRYFQQKYKCCPKYRNGIMAMINVNNGLKVPQGPIPPLISLQITPITPNGFAFFGS